MSAEQENGQENTEEVVAMPAGQWLEMNLPWVEYFWEEMTQETFLRLNPHWELDAEKADEMTYRSFPVKDILFEEDAVVEISKEFSREEVVFEATPLGVRFRFRPFEGGANTQVCYELIADSTWLTGEDLLKTVQFWLQSVREYYRLYENESLKLRFWRMLMNKVMLPQTPVQRRICGFMIKFAMLELVVIAGCGVGIWMYFTR